VTYIRAQLVHLVPVTPCAILFSCEFIPYWEIPYHPTQREKSQEGKTPIPQSLEIKLMYVTPPLTSGPLLKAEVLIKSSETSSKNHKELFSYFSSFQATVFLRKWMFSNPLFLSLLEGPKR
jgi:hypothetical protein